MNNALTRCAWSCRTEEERDYHDREWGVPLHDDRRLFEFIVLEGAQAGLSWITLLKKREGYRAAFDGFVPEIVAGYNQAKILELMENPGIVRNRLKIESAVANARAFLKVQEQFGTFATYMWRFVDGNTLQNAWRDYREAPTQTKESEAMSKDLKKRGFKFVGPTICYAHMQAVGMVNDHAVDCFRWRELGGGSL
jgi:DNA-3-methyladenine glycosylase I